MLKIFKHDLHLHIYGCLTAEDVWELGRDHPKDEARLTFFVDEYEKAYGIRPDWRAVWSNADRGFEILRELFIFDHPGSFAQFQAKFNFLIAMFPINPKDPRIIRKVLARHQAEGIQHIEYRCGLPTDFGKDSLQDYLTTLTTEISRYRSEFAGSFFPSIAISISRRNDLGPNQYQWVREWQKANPKLSERLTGLDFSYFEEGSPPAEKREFFEKILKDNQEDKRNALAILYHVGESFANFSLMSSARWVWQAAEVGAHRLGHGISLGVEPSLLKGRTVTELPSERIAHLNWLKENTHWLKERGYKVSQGIATEMSRLVEKKGLYELTYDDELIEDCRQFQKVLMEDLRDRVVIESCPTSNFRIGQIPDAETHPLRRFLREGLKVVIGSDDPGIFDITLADEEKICREKFGLTQAMIEALAKNSDEALSENLVRKT